MANLGKLCKVPLSYNKAANQAGMSVSQDSQGRYRVKMTNSGALVNVFDSEAEMREFIRNGVNVNAPELDTGTLIPMQGEVASINRPRVGDQPQFGRETISALTSGIASAFTPAKQLAQNYELAGWGRAKSLIYDTTQAAKNVANQAYAYVKREIPGFGETTYNKALQDFNAKVSKLVPEVRRLVTLYGEAYTKQELQQPGVLLAQGLDDADLAASKLFSDIGMAEEIPNLYRTSLLIDDFLKNKAEVSKINLPALKIAVSEGKLDPTIYLRARRMVEAGGGETNFFEVVKSMGLTGNEEQALILLRNYMDLEIPPQMGDLLRGVTKAKGKVYNIPAIYRHATAPDLKPGFKSGRHQFAIERGMSVDAVALAENRLSILREAYKPSGYSADQLVGAQYPIFRQFVDAGIYPWQQTGPAAAGEINTYANVLRESLPEANNVFTRRVLSGHLNPYELHPAVSANKHVRNMILRDTLDPTMPAAKAEAENIAKVDPHAGRLMKDYLNNIEGIPDEGYRNLTKVLRTTARFLGANVDDQMAERLVSTLTKFASQAAIPLRPALVLRNYVQNSLTAAIVGPEAWAAGMKHVLGYGGEGAVAGSKGYSRQNAREAIDFVVRKGVIDPNNVPLHAHSEIFGFDIAKVGGPNVGPVLAQAQDMADKLFDAGFSVYRSGDDWGRAVSFFAGRHRVGKAIEKFMASARDETAIQKLIIDSKAGTFHELVTQKFEMLVRNGEWEPAKDLIGKELADKVHFLYGNANHPVGWGGPVGKLFGQFGTFPVQYLQMMLEGVSRGTVKDRIEFLGTQTLINAGLVYAGAEVFDADLQSWGTFGSLQYAGGPYAEIFMNLFTAWSGNDAQRNLALRSLRMSFPSLDNPASPFLPGSYFASDIRRAFQQDSEYHGFLRAIGVRPLDGGDWQQNLSGINSLVFDGLEWVNEIARP